MVLELLSERLAAWAGAKHQHEPEVLALPPTPFHGQPEHDAARNRHGRLGWE